MQTWVIRERPTRTRPRVEINELLHMSPGLRPLEIAERLGRTPGSIRYLLFKMVRTGEVYQKFWGGEYYPGEVRPE